VFAFFNAPFLNRVRVKQRMRSPLTPTYFPCFCWISVSVLPAGREGVIIR